LLHQRILLFQNIWDATFPVAFANATEVVGQPHLNYFGASMFYQVQDVLPTSVGLFASDAKKHRVVRTTLAHSLTTTR